MTILSEFDSWNFLPICFAAITDRAHAPRRRPLIGVHSAFTRQKVCASCPWEDCSSLTVPLTVIRHPMLLLLPWATTLAMTAGIVVVIVYVQGRLVNFASSGAAFLFK